MRRPTQSPGPAPDTAPHDAEEPLTADPAAIHASLTEWAHAAMRPLEQTPAAHHLLLLRELEHLSHGRYRRLMVLMPPGSAKSTYASVVFPPWWFLRHPRSTIIMASNTTALAAHFGRQVRGLIGLHRAALGYDVRRLDRAAFRFSTTTGGDYLAVGVRGTVVGRRADLIIIDDPVRSQAEADSLRARTRLHEWFRAELTTRLRPGGRMLLVMTRWHHDDLAGRLLNGGAFDHRKPDDRRWKVIELPALAGAGDPLGRAPGAPLWPEWEDAAALAAKRDAVGPRAWAAQYQQAPILAQDNLFKTERIPVLDTIEPAAIERAVRAWDLAATAPAGSGEPDWTVGLKLARRHAGGFVVIDIVRLQADPAEVEAIMRQTAQRDGRDVTIGIPQDPGQAGKAQVRNLTDQLAGFHVIADRETGAKETRAQPAASQAAVANLSVVQASWTGAFLDELRAFPHGTKDDQVDALARALRLLTQGGRPALATNIPFLAR